MSVTPIERPTKSAPVTNRTSPQPNYVPAYPTYEPAVAPQVGVRVRVVTKKRTRPLGILASKIGLFTGVFLLTYVAGAVSGQVAVEKARHQEMDARQRAGVARRAESEIRGRVNALTNSAAVQQWAAARSYVAPDEQNKKPAPAPGQA